MGRGEKKFGSGFQSFLRIMFGLRNVWSDLGSGKGVARGSISGGANTGCAPNFWRLPWRSGRKFFCTQIFIFSAPQAKIFWILEGRRPKKFTFFAPQAKILRILELKKPDFFHFLRRRQKFFEFWPQEARFLSFSAPQAKIFWIWTVVGGKFSLFC